MATILNFIGGNGYFELPAIHQLMLGGFMFGMVFMATDPVTAALYKCWQIYIWFFRRFSWNINKDGKSCISRRHYACNINCKRICPSHRSYGNTK